MKTITVHGEILQETELAILVRCDDEADGVWLPKSRIKYSGECGDTDVEIEIPKMLADEKGFFDGMGGPEVETSPASVETPVKRVFGDNVKWIKEEKITVSQPLSEAEKARYADEMAALDGEIEALKDERAEVSNRLKKAIDAKEEERLALSPLFDPLWSDAPAMYGPDCPLKPASIRRIARNRAYKWLAHHMGMPFKECHISMMDVEQLRHAWRTIKKYSPTPESVWAWAKERRG